MIRIMHVISGLELGGAEAMLLRLILGLDRQSFSQSVVSLSTRGVYGDAVEAYGLPLTVLGMNGLATIPRCIARLSREIKAQQPEIVQTWLYHADLFGLIAARLAGDSAVAWNIRCAGLEFGDVPRSTRWLIPILAKLSFRPEAVLFNSVVGQQSHRAIGYHPRRSEVIPNGFDLDEWRQDDRRRADLCAELGVADNLFLVGMVARYHRMKDHHCFFAAAARIRAHAANVRFVLVGPGITWNNSALVADIDRFGLRDCVFLLGPRNDMPCVMSGLNCLVLTSTSEGFPNVLGEAMASGVPCITTDVGDARFIVGDTGRVVSVGDADRIAGGVLALIATSNEEKMALSMRCRAHIAENFGMASVVTRYADFYREINEQSKQQHSGKSSL